MDKYELNWSELAFGSKKSIKDLKPIFIAPSREMSTNRFTQIIKENLPDGNIVVGNALEDYIDGFEGQPQFKTLKLETIKPIIEKSHFKLPTSRRYKYIRQDKIRESLTCKWLMAFIFPCQAGILPVSIKQNPLSIYISFCFRRGSSYVR